MPGDPTAIGGAPVHLVGVGTKIERVFRRVGGPDHVTRGGVQDPLGLSGRARGVQQKERRFRLHGYTPQSEEA